MKYVPFAIIQAAQHYDPEATGFVRRGVKVTGRKTRSGDAPVCPGGQGVAVPACFGAALLSRRHSGKAGARLPAYQGGNALEKMERPTAWT